MTLEEMEGIAGEVVEALNAKGYRDVEYFKEETTPGEPLLIGFGRGEDDFTLSLDVA